VANVIEHMLCEALVKADPHFTVVGTHGARVRMSEALHDMVAYSNLSDYIIRVIECGDALELAPAREVCFVYIYTIETWGLRAFPVLYRS
jgi:hypothetical protein